MTILSHPYDRLYLGLCLLLMMTSAADALPQFSVRSARACDTCHVQPTGWTDPALAERKCSLNCNVCHVSPSGGGMRTVSGQFYGQQTLPLWGRLMADQVNIVSRVSSPASQPTQATSQPVAAASQPTQATSQPVDQGSGVSASVPPPNSAARYGGLDPTPRFQIGGDLRLAIYTPLGDETDDSTAVFPMQTDLYLAYRPYNPKDFNRGRLTLLASVGAQGSKDEQFDGFSDRFFAREWYAMYHDLPYQTYVRAGRFMPAHGWRLDDHTGFTRQEQRILGQPFDHERQVTGIEVGLNPNYPYVHASVFNIADQWDTPYDHDLGYGGALSAGYRDLGWQAGASVIYGQRNAIEQIPGWAQLAVSLQWAANLFVLADGLPLTYLGEYHMLKTGVDNREAIYGLSAFHELGWLVAQSLNMTVRYDWNDPQLEYRYNTRHRLNLGFEWYPVPFLEVVARYRHNWRHTADRFDIDGDEVLFMLHGWY